MHCLNCGCNQFIIEIEEQEKPFIGSLRSLSADPPYTLIVSCDFCGDGFLKFPNESVHTAYARYIKNAPAR